MYKSRKTSNDKRQLYESIMRSVAKEVKKALFEADKKSEELIKAESKLSQDEKVDLWIAGERDINLDACGADKLRKYYKIAKAKDFTSGVAQIERVAKSKNIKLDKELKESAAGKVVNEEWIDVNTDALFVGDIGYALDEKIYFGVWVDIQHTPDGFVTDGETIYAVVGGTAYGDGTYYDEYRHEFGVDAGVIGVTDLNYIDPSMTKEKLNNLGLVVEVPSGHANVEYYNNEGLISIKIWDKVSKETLYLGEIDTRSEEDDED